MTARLPSRAVPGPGPRYAVAWSRRMRRRTDAPGRGRPGSGVVLSLALIGCQAGPPPPPATQPLTPPAVVAQPVVPPSDVAPTPGPGPTRMARTPAGYELLNQSVRVVIDDASGDVVFWGTPKQVRNTASGSRGIRPTIVGLPDVPPAGQIEKRDDQTWQYIGADANGITWRKSYNLDHDSLLVSYLIRNDHTGPITATVAVVGDLINLRVTAHDAEQFTGVGPLGTVSLHGWDVAHGGPPPPPPVLIQSDAFPLKPGERQGYTTEWRLYPLP